MVYTRKCSKQLRQKLRAPQSILDDFRAWLTSQHVDASKMPLNGIPHNCLDALDQVMGAVDATPVETACVMLRKLEKEIIPALTRGEPARISWARTQIKTIIDLPEKLERARFGPVSEKEN